MSFCSGSKSENNLQQGSNQIHQQPSALMMGCAMSCSLDACVDCLPLKPGGFSIFGLQPEAEPPTELSISDFTLQDTMGAGGFGYVKKGIKLRGEDAGMRYAVKIMRKDSLLARRKGAQCVMTELSILVQLDHPFICNAHYAFQDAKHLYLVLDYCSGGDMRYNLAHSPDRHFSEEAVRFFAAQLILAIEYCHSVNTLHRDVKPENILLTESGYIKLTDFGVSRRVPVTSMECESSSGTHGYMAMEIYFPHHRHGPPADWFALGVTLHEFATGKRPFETNLLKSCRDGLVSPSEFSLVYLHSCHYLSFRCQSFISKLIHVHDSYRLTPRMMRAHPWMQGLNWAQLEKRQLPPPAGTVPNTAFLRTTLTAVDLDKLSKSEKAATIISGEKQLHFLDYRYRNEIRENKYSVGETQVIGDSGSNGTYGEWTQSCALRTTIRRKGSAQAGKMPDEEAKRGNYMLSPAELNYFGIYDSPQSSFDVNKENHLVASQSSACKDGGFCYGGSKNSKNASEAVQRLGAFDDHDFCESMQPSVVVPSDVNSARHQRILMPLDISKPASLHGICKAYNGRHKDCGSDDMSPLDSSENRYFPRRVERAVSSSSIVS